MLENGADESGMTSLSSNRKRRLSQVIKTMRQAEMAQIRASRLLGGRLSECTAGAMRAIALSDLRKASRGSRKIAAARMLGMYLAHVTFSLSLTRTGRIFGRDRTTVRHACAQIEDARDRPGLERSLSLIEPALQRWTARFAARALPPEETP